MVGMPQVAEYLDDPSVAFGVVGQKLVSVDDLGGVAQRW